MKPLLKSFEIYVNNGLKPIALHKNTKIPVLKNWNCWDKESNFNQLKYDKTNIGLLLGDIVDVEGDSEIANDTINDLIGNYQHPIYKSKKSYHHFFINPDPDLTILKFNDIEFRGKNHQSVIPPSQVDGIDYKWVHLLFPIPEMPKSLYDFYLANKKKYLKNHKLKNNEIKPGNTSLFCSICKEKKYINKNRLLCELIAFKAINKISWQCIKCRTKDIRPQVKKIKKIVKNENISDWRDWICRV